MTKKNDSEEEFIKLFLELRHSFEKNRKAQHILSALVIAGFSILGYLVIWVK